MDWQAWRKATGIYHNIAGIPTCIQDALDYVEIAGQSVRTFGDKVERKRLGLGSKCDAVQT
jgi:hypothetical protein